MFHVNCGFNLLRFFVINFIISCTFIYLLTTCFSNTLTINSGAKYVIKLTLYTCVCACVCGVCVCVVCVCVHAQHGMFHALSKCVAVLPTLVT
jgi:hypothetical protein